MSELDNLCRSIETEQNVVVWRRADNVGVAEQGKQLLAEIWPVVEKTESLIFKGFLAEEKQSLHLMLDRMINNLSQSKK